MKVNILNKENFQQFFNTYLIYNLCSNQNHILDCNNKFLLFLIMNPNRILHRNYSVQQTLQNTLKDDSIDILKTYLVKSHLLSPQTNNKQNIGNMDHSNPKFQIKICAWFRSHFNG